MRSRKSSLGQSGSPAVEANTIEYIITAQTGTLGPDSAQWLESVQTKQSKGNLRMDLQVPESEDHGLREVHSGGSPVH